MSEDLLRPSPFLNSKQEWLIESEYCFVFNNQFPVLKGHVLVVPKREIEKFEELSMDEWLDIQMLINQYIKDISAVGFNIGYNAGKIAGQSVAHLHFHIFPHFEGSPGMPKGGYCAAFGDLPDYYKS